VGDIAGGKKIVKDEAFGVQNSEDAGRRPL